MGTYELSAQLMGLATVKITGENAYDLNSEYSWSRNDVRHRGVLSRADSQAFSNASHSRPNRLIAARIVPALRSFAPQSGTVVKRCWQDCAKLDVIPCLDGVPLHIQVMPAFEPHRDKSLQGHK